VAVCIDYEPERNQLRHPCLELAAVPAVQDLLGGEHPAVDLVLPQPLGHPIATLLALMSLGVGA
jgi:hypothetical protein